MLLRMFEKRLRGYRAIGYARGEALLGYAEPPDDFAEHGFGLWAVKVLEGAPFVEFVVAMVAAWPR